MLTYPEAADVLTRAVDHITESPTVPDSPRAIGLEHGHPGHDVRAAILHAMQDANLLDTLEAAAGYPHEAVLSEYVADFGDIPAQDPAIMTARWEGQTNKVVDWSTVATRDVRRDDLLQWGRGRDSVEVARLFRRTAEHLRTLPADEGIGTQIGVVGKDFDERDLDTAVAVLNGGDGGELTDLLDRLFGDDRD